MTTQSSSTSATAYTPPPEMLAAAEKALAEASPEDIALAQKLYVAYGAVTGQRSAVTGDELPTFENCRPLDRAGWLAAARSLASETSGPVASMTLTAWTPTAGTALVGLAQRHVGSAVSDDEGRVDPFLLGLSEIASATRDLAEAERTHGSLGRISAVGGLVDAVAKALLGRVKMLEQSGPISITS